MVGKAVSLVLCNPFQTETQSKREAKLVILRPGALNEMVKGQYKAL